MGIWTLPHLPLVLPSKCHNLKLDCGQLYKLPKLKLYFDSCMYTPGMVAVRQEQTGQLERHTQNGGSTTSDGKF